MSKAESYHFDQKAFEPSGIHRHTRQYFLHLIDAFEADFHEKHQPHFANHLMANDSVMDLITRSLDEQRNYHSGVELIDGEIDLTANMEMDTFSEKKTIYALGSSLPGNEEEPILLVIIPNLPDGMLDLCWYPDDDEEEDVEPVRSVLVDSK